MKGLREGVSIVLYQVFLFLSSIFQLKKILNFKIFNSNACTHRFEINELSFQAYLFKKKQLLNPISFKLFV